MDGVMTPSPTGAAVQLSLKIPACGFVRECRFVCQEMMGWAGGLCYGSEGPPDMSDWPSSNICCVENSLSFSLKSAQTVAFLSAPQ